jgi:hypothetical protein
MSVLRFSLRAWSGIGKAGALIQVAGNVPKFPSRGGSEANNFGNSSSTAAIAFGCHLKQLRRSPKVELRAKRLQGGYKL